MSGIEKEVLMHYGMPRRSGRYPWGSGENPYQHSGDFISRVNELKKQGLTESEIAKKLEILNDKGEPSSTKLRAQLSLAKHERRSIDVATAKALRAKGYSLNQIAEKMGFANDSSVRTLLNEDTANRKNQAIKTADFLRTQIKEKGMIDVGIGVERELGISREKLTEALEILQMEGYPVYGGGVPQVTNKGKQTNIKVICPIGTEHKEIYDYQNIHSITEYASHDGGDTFDKFVYPKSMDSNRLKIRYAEDGGLNKDGVVEIRRGCKDLSLGESHYAQVRILVDNNKYIKGMAVYSDDMPDGIDIIFNTNKPKSTPKDKVLKDIKNDPDNPFGSLIKAGGQSYYIDEHGNRQLSLINKRAEEGDWNDWSNKLPSQFLSKQNTTLIKKQLDLTMADKIDEFDTICSLNNPTLKRTLLQSFSDDCDGAAIHLKSAALPRQRYQVILPLTSVKDNEVYAPNFHNGEKVALVRFPHGGTFEIPILTVNNRIKEGKNVIGNTPIDAIGINKKVADRLSGADFDGDTVLVIPTNDKVKITSTPALKGLEGFDPKLTYGGKPKGTFKEMKNTQNEMGRISNLITDMTLKGATSDELARAVRHSMVVIDAEKHGLDYKQSELDNNINALRKKYQGHINESGKYSEGASTLISLAKSEFNVPKRKGSPIIDKDTGEQTYKEAHEKYIDKRTGVIKIRTQKSTRMAETRDAHTLSSGTKQEEIYANYANKMKALANQARKEMISTPRLNYSPEAKNKYKNEVDSLSAKLNVSLLNAPKERRAQTMANVIVKIKKETYPDLTSGELKKISQQALESCRIKVGAKKAKIEINDKEWEAIQAGAISDNMLKKILDNTRIDDLKQRAMPKANSKLSAAKINKIYTMKASGYTTDEIANALNVSNSTIFNYLKERK